jgi:predicted RNA-binding protein with PIN domain
LVAASPIYRFTNVPILCGVRATVADVVTDDAAEQHGILKRNAHLSAQRIQREVARVHAIQRHPALFHVVKARNQLVDW